MAGVVGKKPSYTGTIDVYDEKKLSQKKVKRGVFLEEKSEKRAKEGEKELLLLFLRISV